MFLRKKCQQIPNIIPKMFMQVRFLRGSPDNFSYFGHSDIKNKHRNSARMKEQVA